MAESEDYSHTHFFTVSSFFRSPFSDITGHILTHQWYGHCEFLETPLIECFEAYGLDAGREKCLVLMNDFIECSRRTKQTKRALAMRVERHRQHFAGEVSKKDKYAEEPKYNAFGFRNIRNP